MFTVCVHFSLFFFVVLCSRPLGVLLLHCLFLSFSFLGFAFSTPTSVFFFLSFTVPSFLYSFFSSRSSFISLLFSITTSFHASAVLFFLSCPRPYPSPFSSPICSLLPHSFSLLLYFSLLVLLLSHHILSSFICVSLHLSSHFFHLSSSSISTHMFSSHFLSSSLLSVIAHRGMTESQPPSLTLPLS